MLKPPGGGSSDIFGTNSSDSDNKPVNTKKYNSHFSIGDDLAEEVTRKASSIDSNDGASTPSQTSTSNGSPNNSEPNTPRSGKQKSAYHFPLQFTGFFWLSSPPSLIQKSTLNLLLYIRRYINPVNRFRDLNLVKEFRKTGKYYYFFFLLVC